MTHQRRSRGLRPRGDGTRGPRTSSSGAARSTMRSVDGCTTAAAIGDVIALLPLWTFLLLQRRVPAVAYVFLFPVFLWFLLGGFNLEGNMQAEDELSEETQVWLQQVEDEQHAIMALGFVKGVAFYYGETANLCKVMATLRCCWSGGNSRT
mmetsp:Transcript_26221/g.83283  ORF Transcript_26221/g.83283 Transcript_26221/m.83283 type:complete len:151 (-) Transcript_26221:45-497(-)